MVTMNNILNKDGFDEMLKKLGLTQINTSKAIDDIAFQILHTTYKNIDAIVKPHRLEKPIKPKALIKPTEPFKPLEPSKPAIMELNSTVFNILSESDKQSLTKEVAEQIKQYEQEKKQYVENIKKYEVDLKNYYINLQKYELEKPKYLMEIKQYENELNHYLEREKQYAEYEKRVQEAKIINKKIEDVYKKWTGGMEYLKQNRRSAPISLLGPPGHGKTTAFREAAKRVAKALDMVYMEDPADGVYIDSNTFVFSVLQLGGQVTTTAIAGIPSKNSKRNEQGDVESFMTLLPEYRIVGLQKSGASLLLLDDFPNASESVQNGVGLQLTNEGKLNGLNLENTYIGVTGNLGSAYDGTNTYKTSAAFSSRTQTYAVRDNFEDFQERTLRRVSDQLGDVYLVSFFELYKNKFDSLENRNEKQGGFTSPRSIDNCIDELRKKVYRAGGTDNIFTITNELKTLAISMLGIDTGTEFGAYLDGINNSAYPYAKKLVETKKYIPIRDFENTNSVKDNTFIHYFKSALVSEVVVSYRKQKIDLADIAKIYFNAFLAFKDNENTLTEISHAFVKGMCFSLPELQDLEKDPQGNSLTKFKLEVNQVLANNMAQYCNEINSDKNSTIRITENELNKIFNSFLGQTTAASALLSGMDVETTEKENIAPRRTRKNTL